MRLSSRPGGIFPNDRRLWRLFGGTRFQESHTEAAGAVRGERSHAGHRVGFRDGVRVAAVRPDSFGAADGGGAFLKHVLAERPPPWITGIEEAFPFEKRLFSNQTTPMGAPVSLTTDAGASSFPELAAEEPAELVATVREGLPTERFDALRELLDVPSGRLAEIVGITPSTLSRRRKHGTFNKDESERILRVARLALRAIDVLDGRNNAQKWLTEPARALGGEPPLDFADTEPGAREVERLLIRLDHGVYS